jgi:hypothetical protein
MPLSQRPYGVSNTPPSGLMAQTLNSPAIQGNPLPSTIVNPGIVETVFANPVILNTALILSVPNDTLMEALPWKIYASGSMAVGALTVTAQIGLYAGTSLTVGLNKLLKKATAVTPTDLIFPWFLDGTAIYDSRSGLLHGSVGFQIDNQLVAAAAFNNAVTLVNNDNSPVVSLVLTVQFGTANANNSCTVTAFSAG